MDQNITGSLGSEELSSQDLQIVEFLASGQPASEVAGILGVSTELIQQRLGDSGIRARIKERGSELRVQRVESKYAQTEEKILDKIKKYADDEFAEIPSLVRALEVIAKNRVLYRNPAGLGANNLNTTNNNFVTLMLPEAARSAEHVVVNSNGEIIAVGERNMSSMPIDGVKQIFSELERQNVARRENRNVHNSEHISEATSA